MLVKSSKNLAVAVVLMGAGLGLSACGGGVQAALGLEKRTPDEFTVVTKAPLIIPPDFTLRPPRPGAPGPREASPRETARRAVIGSSGAQTQKARDILLGSSASADASQGEKLLLRVAKAENASSDIREIIEEENATIADDRTFLEKVLYWRKEDQDLGTAVDPEKESKRLRRNSALGQPANTGEVPTIKRKKRGLFNF